MLIWVYTRKRILISVYSSRNRILIWVCTSEADIDLGVHTEADIDLGVHTEPDIDLGVHTAPDIDLGVPHGMSDIDLECAH